MMLEFYILLRIVKGQLAQALLIDRKKRKMIEAFVSSYAGSLIPFIEESFPEWFAIVTSLEKEAL